MFLNGQTKVTDVTYTVYQHESREQYEIREEVSADYQQEVAYY
jgi:hypothetical protein